MYRRHSLHLLRAAKSGTTKRLTVRPSRTRGCRRFRTAEDVSNFDYLLGCLPAYQCVYLALPSTVGRGSPSSQTLLPEAQAASHAEGVSKLFWLPWRSKPWVMVRGGKEIPTHLKPVEDERLALHVAAIVVPSEKRRRADTGLNPLLTRRRIGCWKIERNQIFYIDSNFKNRLNTSKAINLMIKKQK